MISTPKTSIPVKMLRFIGRIGLPRFAARHSIALLQWTRRVLGTVALWICAKKQFWSVVLIGLAAAYLCRNLPVVGNVLAILVTGLSALHGFALQINVDKRKRFRAAYSGREADYYDSDMM